MPSSTGTLVFNDQKIQAPDIYATESLGVGVSDPTSNLQVAGNAYVSSNLEVGTSNLFVDTTTGRVGVGTGSPSYNLDNYFSDARISGETSYYVSASGINTSTYTYLGRFTTYGPVTVKFGCDGNSSFSANYALFTRQFNDKPTVAYLLNGDQYLTHQFFYQTVDFYSYDVWHRQGTYDNNYVMRFHVSGYGVTKPTAPTSPTYTECAYGHVEKQRPGGGIYTGIGKTNPGATLDVNGYIKNTNPCFHARRNSAYSTNYSYIPFNIQEYDSTNSYNTNGTFTAPISGYYYFHVFVLSNGATHVHLEFHKNGSVVNNAEPYTDNLGSYANVAGSIVVYLNTNDYIQMYLIGGAIYGGGNDHNGFCGHFLG